MTGQNEYIIPDGEELATKFIELVHICNNMRYTQKYWHIHFGSNAKEAKERWEKQMDEKLLHYVPHHNTKKIMVNKNDQP